MDCHGSATSAGRNAGILWGKIYFNMILWKKRKCSLIFINLRYINKDVCSQQDPQPGYLVMPCCDIIMHEYDDFTRSYLSYLPVTI